MRDSLSIITSAPHAGQHIPDVLEKRTIFTISPFERFNHIDPTTEKVAAVESEAATFYNQFHRALGDYNRCPDGVFNGSAFITFGSKIPIWEQELTNTELKILFEGYKRYYTTLERSIQRLSEIDNRWLFVDVHNAGDRVQKDIHLTDMPHGNGHGKFFYRGLVYNDGENLSLMPPFILSNRGLEGSGEAESDKPDDYISCPPDLLFELKFLLEKDPEVWRIIENYFVNLLKDPTLPSHFKNDVEDGLLDPVKINYAGLRGKKGTITSHVGHPRFRDDEKRMMALQMEFHKGMTVDQTTGKIFQDRVVLLNKCLDKALRKVFPNLV